ncbi:MAG: S8 family serine peptidase [Butyrivibrio sp.]|nr:S8 family serine peptidase [Butyrivibrio sp.]
MKSKLVNKLLAGLLALSMIAGQAPAAMAAEPDESSFESSEESSAAFSSEEEDTEEEENLSDEEDELTPGAGNEDIEDEDESSEDENESLSEASVEASSEEAADAASSADSEEEAEIIEELPEGLVGMPEGYKLSSYERKLKEDANDHNVFADFSSMSEGSDYEKDEVICLASSKEHAKTIAEAYGGELGDYSYGIASIDLGESKLSVEDAFKYSLDEDYELPLVMPNYIIEIEEPVADDSETLSGAGEVPFLQGWEDWYYTNGFDDPALNPSSPDFQWFHEAIGTYGAWGVTTGSSDIVVAVLDSGVNVNHVEFEGKIKTSSYNPGYAADEDIVGHGSHVAGIVGALAGNDKGGAGVAPGVTIMPVGVATYPTEENPKGGGVYTLLMLRGMAYIAGVSESGVDNIVSENYMSDALEITEERKADIVNISIGSPMYSPIEKACIDALYKSGVTVVSSMGNDSTNTAGYPAAMDHVIGVVATNYNGSKASFTNFGYKADIAAPGVDIYSTYRGGDENYEYLSGTSMASPVVAGACALYMSAVGHVDPDTMEAVLKASATKGSSGMGAGILNVANMLKGDTTGPAIELRDYTDEAKAAHEADSTVPDYIVTGSAENGQNITLSDAVSSSAYVSFASLNFGGGLNGYNYAREDGSFEGDGNANTKIVYTIDGTTPSVLNGNITNGNLLTGSGINIEDFITEGIASKVTVKAIAVTGMGVSSKVTTLVFDYDPDLDFVPGDDDYGTGHSSKTVTITNAPTRMIAGKSIVLTAKVTPEDASQSVKWSIVAGGLSKAKIDAKGKLTTAAGQVGPITVECATADGDAKTLARIEVVNNVSAVKTMSIAADKKALKIVSAKDFGAYTEEEDDSRKAVVYVSQLKDTKGKNLITEDRVRDVAVTWTSSNKNVVYVDEYDKGIIEIEGLGNTHYAVLKAMSPGTATITCAAMDGSGKKAVLKVTVSSTGKIVNKVEVWNKADDTNKKAVTSGSIYVGDKITLVARQKNNAGQELVEVASPVWTIDKTGIAGLSIAGYEASLTATKAGTVKLTCTARDGSGKKAVYALKVLQPATKAEMKGVGAIATGTSSKFSVSMTPSKCDEKVTTWSVGKVSGGSVEPVTGLSVKSGTVTVAKDFVIDDEATYRVVAATSYNDRTVAADFRIVSEATKLETGFSELPATYAGLLIDDIDPEALVMWKNLDHYIEGYVSAKTDNGTKPAFTASTKNIVITSVSDVSDASGYWWASFKAVSPGKIKITVSSTDGSGLKKVLESRADQAPTGLTLTGQTNIVKGTSAKYKAKVLPAKAAEKRIKWTLSTEEGEGVTIDQTGKVTVDSSCELDHFTVYAEVWPKALVITSPLTNFFGLKKSIIVHVSDYKATGVSLDTAKARSEYEPIFKVTSDKKKNTLTSVQLTDTKVDFLPGNPNYDEALGKPVDSTRITLKANVTGGEINGPAILWKSSNSKVATVDEDGNVTAVSKGSATISAEASDGSGKKATVKVNVITPASNVNLVIKNNQGTYLAYKKSASLAAKLGNTYGKPSVNKVTWDYRFVWVVYWMDSNGREVEKEKFYIVEDEDDTVGKALEKEIKKKKLFYTMSGGKVTSKCKNDNAYWKQIYKYYNNPTYRDKMKFYLPQTKTIEVDGKETVCTSDALFYVEVTAKTTDGTELVSDSKSFSGINNYGKVFLSSNGWKKISKLNINNISKSFWTLRLYNYAGGGCTVTSSNPSVCTAYMSGSTLVITPRYFENGKTGKAKITVKVNDGTNRTTSVTVTVKK